MKMTTEEAFVKVLQMHGIENAFGIIGSAMMPISDLFPQACGNRSEIGIIAEPIMPKAFSMPCICNTFTNASSVVIFMSVTLSLNQVIVKMVCRQMLVFWTVASRLKFMSEADRKL